MKQAATETCHRHPAKFTDAILDEAYSLVLNKTGLGMGCSMYDPFAGTGKGVDYFRERGWQAFGTELEPEWAYQSELVLCADSLEWMTQAPEHRTIIDTEGVPFGPWFDLVFTSPAYGNRMADHHEARDSSRRNTYRHALERPLSPGSSAGLQWGDSYRTFHVKAWQAVKEVLRPGGWFLLNVKDHIRGGQQQGVPDWHWHTVRDLGFEPRPNGAKFVQTLGNRQGANGNLRVRGEWLFLFRKPDDLA